MGTRPGPSVTSGEFMEVKTSAKKFGSPREGLSELSPSAAIVLGA